MLTVRRLLGAFVAVTLGVAVVASSCLLLAAGRPAVPDRVARAAVVVQSPAARTPADPFPPTVPWSAAAAHGLATRLDALPGVAAAVADRAFYAQPLGDDRITEGHGWSSAGMGRARLVTGRPPQRPGEVVLDRAPGPVTLLTATGPASYQVTGTIDRPELYLADPVAASLAPGVHAIGLVLEEGADPERVAAAARQVVGPGDQVHTGDARAALEPRADARTRWIGMQILTGTAALAAFATVFVVAATFALVVAQRRRELALLRTVGALPRQVSRLVRREALIVGAAGSLLGTALGAGLAPLLGRVLVHSGMEPASYTVRFTAWPILAALLLGPVVAVLGVSVSAWRAARVPPQEALRDAAVEQRPMGRPRWATGMLLAALGVLGAVGVATADDAQQGGNLTLLSAMALVAGAAVLSPAVVPAVARLLTWPAARLPGATALLVRQGLRAAPRRTAATAAPVLLTVAFAVLVSGLVQTTMEADAVGSTTAVQADRVVAPDGTPGLTDAAAAAVSGVAVLPTTVFAGDRPLTALGVEPGPWAAAQRRLRVLSGSLPALHDPGAVAITESYAAALTATTPPNAAPGSPSPAAGTRSSTAGSPSLRSDSPGSVSASHGAPIPASAAPFPASAPSFPASGPSFPASAPSLSASGPSFPASGPVSPAAGPSLSASVPLGSASGSPPPKALELTFADGSRSTLRVVAVIADGVIAGDLLLPRDTVRRHDPSALTAAVYVDGPVTVPAGSGAQVVSVRAYAAEADAAEDRLVWLFTVLLITVSAGYGAIAVATTLLMAASGRGPDLRVLHRTGATIGRIRRALAAEAAVVVAIGALLGGAAAAAALLGVRAGLSEQVGTSVPLVVPWPVVGAVVGVCLLLAIGAALLPTFTTRPRPAA